MKNSFIKLLESTGRKGMDKVVDYLEKSGFFTAPASVNRHLSCDGGLMQHSLNVYNAAVRIRLAMLDLKPEAADLLKEDSVIIVTLLHDICKSSIYHKVPKFRKDENGRWETYDGYDVDYSRFPIGHGEKSVIMLLRLGLELSNDELLAIRWHMSAWDLPFQSYEQKTNISLASDVPLVALLQSADSMAAHFLEI